VTLLGVPSHTLIIPKHGVTAYVLPLVVIDFFPFVGLSGQWRERHMARNEIEDVARALSAPARVTISDERLHQGHDLHANLAIEIAIVVEQASGAKFELGMLK
jgi:cytochrome P450